MKRSVNLILVFIFLLAWSAMGMPVQALASNSGGMVISHAVIGSSSSPRVVEITNNSSQPVDVTGWCLWYSSASGASKNVSACIVGAVVDEHIILSPGSNILIGSTQLAGVFNYMMTGGMGTGPAGRLYIVDSAGIVIDTFAWGEGTSLAETAPKVRSLSNVYERRQLDGIYIDTNNNAADFIDGVLRPSYVAVPLTAVVDVCVNLPGLQVDVPDGYESVDGLNCTPPVVDLCVNVDAVQAVLPVGMERGDDGHCVADACLNLDGFQDVVPNGLLNDDSGECRLMSAALEVTELLPNPDGEDLGNEFIEIYNPNDQPVDLKYYYLEVGDKQYKFDTSRMIAPRSFVAIYNSELSFSLVNTKGGVRLVSFDGVYKSEVPEYINAPSAKSWSLIDGVWQYVAKPTPASVNELPVVVYSTSTAAASTDCGEGRERNPITNRCRNITTATSILQPCKEGQYRSEETNRCRSLASLVSSSLKPCADDQFRSPETNRCRKIASADDTALADCGEGRERNPETNRCRNVLAKSSNIPAAAFAVEPIAQGAEVFVGWWALGGVMAAALTYVAWEWRHEVRRAARKIAIATHLRK